MGKMIVLKILPVMAVFCVCEIASDDSIFTVNTKKALHTVSDKFLSFTIDPAVLLTGFNLSDTSLKLARNLSPALIRIAGPSTEYVKYVDFEDESLEHPSEDTANIVVTPSIWLGINEWFSLANLTPVFGINDFDTTRGRWNPKSTLPLLEISDKLNVTCYWQLGYDCSNKTELQYKEDLVIFRHILDAFPDKRANWKIIGSDLSKCRRAEEPHTDVGRRTGSDLGEVLDAVVLESNHNSAEDVDAAKARSPFLRSKVPLWTTSSKPYHPVSFASALSWAQELGDAATRGFEVFFRQPRLHELFSDTPVYWLSVLYKRLMGTHVLDIKPTASHVTTSVYAHCTKNQNNFVRSGAMTVLAVNNGTTNHTVLLRFGNSILKTIEVQSYILTSPHEGSTDIYLNGNKMNMKNSEFNPKLRIAKLMNYLSLSLPPKSIGFFVLPSARIPVCINEEVETELLLEEIYEDQHVPFEVSVEVQPRISHHKKPPTLKELHAMMEKELQSDERYYKRTRSKPTPRTRPSEEPKAKTPKEIVDARNFFIERARLAEKQRKQVDTDHKKHIVVKELPKVEASPRRELELELTNAEIRKVLAERAKAKAAQKNIMFTSRELDEIMAKATDKYLKNSNIKIKPKLKRSVVPTQRDKKDINMKLLNFKTLGEKRRVLLKQQLDNIKHHKDHNHKDHSHKGSGHNGHEREKRAINLDLLKKRAVEPTSVQKFHNKDEKEATMRDSAQTSAELLNDDFAETGPTTPQNVFAGLASFEEAVTDEAVVRFNDFKSKQNLFGGGLLPHHDLPTEKFGSFGNFHQILKPSELDLTGEVQYSSESFESGNGDGDFPCIHEYFGRSSAPSSPSGPGNPNKGNAKLMMSELWEISEMPVEDKKDNHLTPALATRGLLDNVRLENIESALRNHEFGLGNDNFSPIDDDYGDLADKIDDVRFKRDAASIKIDSDNLEESLKNQQIQLLKQRLYQHKVLNMLCKNHDDDLTRNNDPPRTPLEIAESPINKRYKSLTEGLKVWKPAAASTADVLNPKPNPIRSRRRRRSDQMDKRGNEIDFNDLLKDTQIIDADNDGRDYKLIFPNKDRIEIAAAGGDGGDGGDRKKTEVKLVLHEEPENVTITEGNPAKVNEATEKSAEITTNEADNSIEKDAAAPPADADGGGEKINGTMAMKRVQGHVQKIAPRDLWGGMWRKVQGFFQDLGGKLQSCMQFLTGK